MTTSPNLRDTAQLTGKHGAVTTSPVDPATTPAAVSPAPPSSHPGRRGAILEVQRLLDAEYVICDESSRRASINHTTA